MQTGGITAIGSGRTSDPWLVLPGQTKGTSGTPHPARASTKAMITHFDMPSSGSATARP
jgi:hypothetical protein